MLRIILKALNVERGEEKSVLLLLIQSVFLGTFFATFEISSTALFLAEFGAEKLPFAFLISGLAGIVLTLAYTQLQRAIPFSNLSLINLLFIAILTLGMRLGFEFFSSRYLIFVILVLMGPLNVLGIVGFWGMAARLFSLRQGKRLFGMIDSGQILGMMVISFAIPFLLSILGDSKNLIIISASSALVALYVQWIIVKNFDLDKDAQTIKKTIEEDTTSQNTFAMLFKDKYISVMALFVILSMVSAFFVHYSFLSVTDAKYPDETELAGFLGVFTGIIMIFSFIFKTFIYSKLISTYGLKVGLLVLPLLLGFFTVVAAVTGSFTGQDSTTDNFIFFFMIIALSKLFAQSLKASIEIPAFKLFYQPLHISIRYDIQAKIDGIVNEVAAFAGGLIMVALGSLAFFELLHFSYVLALIVGAWIYVSFKLFGQYRERLQDSLATAKSSTDVAESSSYMERLMAAPDVSSKPNKLVYAMQIAERMEPTFHESSITTMISNKFGSVRKYCLNAISSLKLYELFEEIKPRIANEEDSKVKNQLRITTDLLNQEGDPDISIAAIQKLGKSKTPAERLYAAKLIGINKSSDLVNALSDLMKDADPKVRRMAIKTLAKTKFRVLYPQLIDNLSVLKYQSDATAAIVILGEDCLEYLDHSFFKSDADIDSLTAIAKIYGLIGGDKAEAYLMDKISFQDNRVVKEVLISLGRCKFQADGTYASQIQQAIESYIGVAAWDLAALSDLKEADASPRLIEAVEEELNSAHAQIFMLLSLIYDPNSISHVRENIESGTGEGIGFAIELLDLFVSEDLKPKLFPLFEDLPPREKITRLQTFYPLESYELLEVLQNLINRDYNHINAWTKACALYNLMDFPDVKIDDYIIANLFNPNPLLRETAACVVDKFDREVYENCKRRLPEDILLELEQSLFALKSDTSHLLIEKAFFLDKVREFNGVPRNVVASLAEQTTEKSFVKGTVISSKNDGDSMIGFVISGSAAVIRGDETLLELHETDPIGEMSILEEDEAEVIIKATTDVKLYVVEKQHFYNLMFHHMELSNSLIKMMDKRVDESVETVR